MRHVGCCGTRVCSGAAGDGCGGWSGCVALRCPQLLASALTRARMCFTSDSHMLRLHTQPRYAGQATWRDAAVSPHGVVACLVAADETDVDCGGACGAGSCAAGQTCATTDAASCASGRCFSQDGTTTGVCTPEGGFNNHKGAPVTTVLENCGSGDTYDFVPSAGIQRYVNNRIVVQAVACGALVLRAGTSTRFAAVSAAM